MSRSRDPETSSSLFSSDRERRLWMWALVAIVAIFSTLGLATTLAGIFGDQTLIGGLFFLCFILVLVAVLTQRARIRPRGIEIGVTLGIVAVYLLVIVRMAIPPSNDWGLCRFL